MYIKRVENNVDELNEDTKEFMTAKADRLKVYKTQIKYNKKEKDKIWKMYRKRLRRSQMRNQKSARDLGMKVWKTFNIQAI